MNWVYFRTTKVLREQFSRILSLLGVYNPPKKKKMIATHFCIVICLSPGL